MKSTVARRPARRIPAARLERLRATVAAQKQAREDALAQLISPTPEFEPAPRLTMLPGGLHWSNQVPVPPVGATVTVTRDGHTEQAEVKGYCHAAGFLGLVTEAPAQAKDTSRKKRSPRAGFVFGSQLAPAA